MHLGKSIPDGRSSQDNAQRDPGSLRVERWAMLGVQCGGRRAGAGEGRRAEKGKGQGAWGPELGTRASLPVGGEATTGCVQKQSPPSRQQQMTRSRGCTCTLPVWSVQTCLDADVLTLQAR